MSNLFEKYATLNQGLFYLTPKETKKLIKDGVFLVDLRMTDYSDYKAFNVENVISLPMEEFDEHLSNLNPADYYVLADASGLKIRQFAQRMIDKGFKNVAGMSGGFVEWERDGLPVRVDVNERLSGACACQLKPRERGKCEN